MDQLHEHAPRTSLTPFQQWMREVDCLCYERYGVSIHDLPDRLFHDAFDSGMSPEEYMDQESDDLGAILG